MQSERPSNRLFGCSRYHPNRTPTPTIDLIGYENVTVDDVSSAAKTYFDGSHFNEIVVSSEESYGKVDITLVITKRGPKGQ